MSWLTDKWQRRHARIKVNQVDACIGRSEKVSWLAMRHLGTYRDVYYPEQSEPFTARYDSQKALALGSPYWRGEECSHCGGRTEPRLWHRLTTIPSIEPSETVTVPWPEGIV